MFYASNKCQASTSELTTGKEESASLTTSEAKNAKNLK